MTLFFEQLKQSTAAAQQAMLTAPVIGDVQQGNISKEMYIAFLTQAYHHVKHTVPLLMACGGDYLANTNGYEKPLPSTLRKRKAIKNGF